MRKILSVLFLALVLAFASGGFALAQGVGAGIVGPPTTCTLSSCTTNSAAGFQQNGSPLITGGTQAAAPVTLVGKGAGAAINLATAVWDTYVGEESGNAFTGTSGENTAVGSVSLLLNVSGTFDTVLGSRVGGSFTADSSVTCGGDDAARNTVGATQITCFGEGSQRNGGASGGILASSSYGFWSMRGNAGSVAVSGSKTTNDVISLVFTFGGSLPYALPGTPVTVTYTVLAGDTLSTITTGLIAAINASTGLQAAAPVQVTAYDTDPINPTAFGVDFAGTSATGSKIVMTYSVSGSATEILTIGGGVSGVDNICVGDEACLYAEATTPTENIGIGKLTLAEQTIGNNDVAIGPFAGEFLTGANDARNALLGSFAGQGALGTSYFNTTAIGYAAGQDLTAGSNSVFVGYQACLTCTNPSNGIYIGGSSETGVAATAQGQVVIGHSVAAPNINFAVNIDNVLTGTGNGATNPTTCSIGQPCIIGILRSANLNATTDQSVTIAPMTSANAGFLSTATKYIVTGMFVTNCSTAASTAAGGLYDAASKGGNPLVAAAQTYTSCASASTMQTATLAAIATTTVETTATLFFSLTAGHGSAATGDVYVLGIPFN